MSKATTPAWIQALSLAAIALMMFFVLAMATIQYAQLLGALSQTETGSGQNMQGCDPDAEFC